MLREAWQKIALQKANFQEAAVGQGSSARPQITKFALKILRGNSPALRHPGYAPGGPGDFGQYVSQMSRI